MMEFDYLEKTVQNSDDRVHSRNSKNDDDDDDDDVDHWFKHSKSKGNGDRKRDRDRRNRGSESEREKERSQRRHDRVNRDREIRYSYLFNIYSFNCFLGLAYQTWNTRHLRISLSKGGGIISYAVQQS